MSIERRCFLRGMVGAAAGLLVRRGACAQSDADARLVVMYEDAGLPIPSDFVGLSYESAILVRGDYFNPENESVLGLVRLLGSSGVIRIGGNTSEHTVWGSEPRPLTSGAFTITPASVDRLAAVLRLLGWKLIYGLNLARGTTEDAAQEAAYVARVVGANLLAFQIGNEPDGFGRWTAVRPRTYDVAAFLAEWHKFHAAISARVPDARFAGPDVAGETDWAAAFAQAHPAGLVLLTGHYYAEGPAGAPDVTLTKLLRSDADAERMLETLACEARAYDLPYRIVEANSVYNEGQPGVSDTVGAALWGLEFMFEAAAAGAAGVNFHAGVHNLRPDDDKAYTPIGRSAGGRHRARPLYYGMLMFAQAARGALIGTDVRSDRRDLKAFAIRTPEGELRICLINKDFTRGARIRIEAGRGFAVGSMMRLTGPALDATQGVRLGGASVDELGRWVPEVNEAIYLNSHEGIIDVPAASAAVVFLDN